ncbi:thioredoxin domain-containing protein [Parabacteroides sp. OttesenSCG-928-G07]|nr:thioredoxin domain-containing protein [Parabacteroides sp. OttesenSCG-928-G07]
MKTHDLLSYLFSYLNIKYTNSYLNKLYHEHPNKNNLLGLSQILSKYEIDNIAVRVKEQEKESFLNEVGAPLIANFGNEFILVSKFTTKSVHYIWENKKMILPIEKFIEAWNGVALIAESNEKSIEPGYSTNRKNEAILVWGKNILVSILVFFIGVIILSSNLYASVPLMLSLVINFFGLWISYLLILKQLHQQSDYADKICSVFHQHDCNDVLETDASKLFGILSWSEIGFGYFFANIAILLFFPALYPYLSLVNICALPYTVWSVLYQKFVVKQWCPLCLLVQLTLWLLFMNNLLFGLITWPGFDFLSLFMIGCIYAIPILFIYLLLPNLAETDKMAEITHEMNSIKAEEKVFNTLLKAEQKYDVDRHTSSILWGNPEAKNLITVVSNPHCNPCAKMHERLRNLLEDTKNGYCIQYIFSSFNDELYKSNKLLISMYNQMPKEKFLSFLEEWFTEGKNKKEVFYEKYKFNQEDPALLDELKKHSNWLIQTKIVKTPTILFNGYELPHNYKIEDLTYFSKIEGYYKYEIIGL